jgi:hypothetical protein
MGGNLMKKNKIVSGIAILIMLLITVPACHRDCPTCLKPPEPGSYYVYLADYLREYNPVIWVVDSRIDAVIDSIETPSNDITVMDVSADGRYLAILIPSADTDYVFDCGSGQIVTRITPAGIPVLTNDGNSVIICNLGGGQPGKYDIATGALISHDTLIYTNYGKSLSKPWIYGTVTNFDSASICIYDYEAMQIVKAFNV